MDALDLVRMGNPLDLRTQLRWARSQRTRQPSERLLLYELVALADGGREVRASTSLLSGLIGLPSFKVRSALDRLQDINAITLRKDAQGDQVVVLAFPPTPDQIDGLCAHVRVEGGS